MGTDHEHGDHQGGRRSTLGEHHKKGPRGSTASQSPSLRPQASGMSLVNSASVMSAGGIFTDEAGGTRFRFKRNSIYEPLPQPVAEGRKTRRLSILSAGSGICGPLIADQILSSTTHIGSTTELDGGEPRKKLKLLGCIGVIFGVVLGSGVFAAPQEILNYTGSSGTTLIIWFAYGIVAMLGALSYIELGCTIPVPGGDYAYLNECWGPMAAFLFQWTSNLIIIPSIIGLVASVAATNLVYPWMDPNCGDLTTEGIVMMKCITVSFIMLVVYMNCKGPALTAKIQGWLMIINIGAIILMFVCAASAIAQRRGFASPEKFKLIWPTKTRNSAGVVQDLGAKQAILNLVLATYQASFSFSGYTFVTYIMEDVENPLRTLPLAIVISMPCIMIVLIAVNFSYFASVPYDQLINTKSVATDMMAQIVLTNGHPHKYNRYYSWIAPMMVVIAVLGALLSCSLTSSRLACLGARNGHWPKMFELIHYKNDSPILSIIFLSSLAVIYLNFMGIKRLIGLLTYCQAMVNGSVIYGLIYLRCTRKDLPRPFKLPLIIPILYAGVNTFLFLTPICLLDGNSYKETLPILGGSVCIFLLGIPVYFLLIKKEWRGLTRCHWKFMVFFQKLALVALPEYGLVMDKEPRDVEEEESSKMIHENDYATTQPPNAGKENDKTD